MRHLIPVLFILIVFDTLRFTPLELLADFFLLSLAVIGIVRYYALKINRITEARYIFNIATLLIISSSVAAIFVTKQDLLSTLFATRHLFKVYAVFYFSPQLRAGAWNLDKITRTLEKFAWPYAILVGFIGLLNWTFVFQSPFSGQVLVVTGAKFSKVIIVFFILFYLSKYFKHGGVSNILKAVILFATTQTYDIQRGDFVFMVVILLLLVYKNLKTNRVRNIIILSPVIGGGLVLTIMFLNTGRIEDKFEQMLLLFSPDEHNAIKDPAIFVRIRETNFAVEKFSSSPIIGNGIIRDSMKEKLLGNVYFYPADVGVFGLLFCFGLVGLIPVLFASTWIIREFPKRYDHHLIHAFYFFAMYSLLYSIKDGGIVLFPGSFVAAVVIVAFLSKTPSNVNEGA